MPFAQPGNNNNNMGRVGDNPGPAEMFNALPIITRYWFGATMVVTLAVNFKVLNGFQIMWSWEFVTKNFEIWRFLTPFLFAGSFSFNTLIACYMLVSFSKQYESGGPFNTGAGGGTADYAACLLFGTIGILVSYPLFITLGLGVSPVFCVNLIYYVLYIWSKKYASTKASIWGFPIQGIYLPFAYLTMTVFMGNPYMDMLQGMAVGHLYYFAVDVIPQVYGRDFLHTPKFLIDYFGVGEYQEPAAAAAVAVGNNNNNNRGGGFGSIGGGGGSVGAGGVGDGGSTNAAPRSSGHLWGSGGQRLGTN